ncbi:MAG: exodeoxyribonuclease VII large subunit [Eubacterium sp.]|nr:exodeoxyribonuclease VII large subunit [Candidatus Colimonas fimequi]
MGLKPVSVTQLNSYIKRILQTDPILGNVSVIGEISNLKFHGSGHVYFSLKDSKSTVSCFLPADCLDRIDFKLEEGKEVTAHGYIYLYERGGRYSINIRDMEESGEGKLMQEFRRLQKKLEAQGLFNPEHKKPIPTFPYKVAVVTAETGAAVRDILKIIKNKNNFVDVLIYPVLVQGPAAAGEIAAAIDDINSRFKDIDVIIAGRGGGSMEDLWAFNEEVVAWSIYRSEIPVISAVGHEIDFTIADFVADRRAETPTAAADMAVPDTKQIREYLDTLADDMKRNLMLRVQINDNKLKSMDPSAGLRDLKSRIVMEQMRVDNLIDSMKSSLDNTIINLRNRVELAGRALDSSNPQLLLARGYSLVTDDEGNIIRDSGQLAEGQKIDIKFSNGEATAEVKSVRTR